MNARRPLECPICGHDRMERRPHPPSADAGRPGARRTAWACRLCAYRWLEPLAPPQDAWEPI